MAKKNQVFTDHAENAAELEKAGRYTEAAFGWHVASQHAYTKSEIDWSEKRHQFCALWGTRYALGVAV